MIYQMKIIANVKISKKMSKSEIVNDILASSVSQDKSSFQKEA